MFSVFGTEQLINKCFGRKGGRKEEGRKERGGEGGREEERKLVKKLILLDFTGLKQWSGVKLPALQCYLPFTK